MVRGLFESGNYGFIIAVLAVTLIFAVFIVAQIQSGSHSPPVQAMRDVYYSVIGAPVESQPTASPPPAPSASPTPSPTPAPTVSPAYGK